MSDWIDDRVCEMSIPGKVALVAGCILAMTLSTIAVVVVVVGAIWALVA